MEKGNPGHMDDELTQAQIASQEPEPRVPSMIVGNATGPAFAVEMAYEPSVMVCSAEATEIFKALKQDDASNIEPLLKGYSGEPPGAVLRITRTQPVGGACRCSVIAMTQPDGLHGVGENLGARGQGLFARFLWVGAEKTGETDGVIDDDLKSSWNQRILGMLRRPGPVRDAWGVESGMPTVVRLEPHQTERVLALEARLRARIEPGGDLYGVDTWARKAHGQVCRIAALLASVDGVVTCVPDHILDWAINLVEHVLIPHAKYAASVMSWPTGTDDAVHLFALLNKPQYSGRSTFALTEIDGWVPEWPTEQTDRALVALTNRGYASVSGKLRAERVVTFRRT
jgi:hypothetical protein